MEREISIDGKVVRFRATAALTRLYRIKFSRDILQDMLKLHAAYMRVMGKSSLKEMSDSLDSLTEEQALKMFSVLDLEMFEDVAYIMAKHADPEGTSSSIEAWLEQFETFSIYVVLPELLSLWVDNMQTQAESKKKLEAVAAN